MSADRTSDEVHYRACNLCEAICGLKITLENGAIRSIRGDDDDPFSRGHICAKAVALQDIQNDPDRLRRPLRRVGSDFEEIGWDEAFDEAADRLRDIRTRHGAAALASYAGNPNVHNWGSLLYGPRFQRALRPGNRFSATSVDQLPHHLASYLMFGHQMLLPVPDIERTAFLLVLGANPLVSNGSMMTAPDIRKRLGEIQSRGGRIVVVDPCRTRTAELADQHLFIRPGTDAWLLAALINAVFDEELAQEQAMPGFVRGAGTVRRLLEGFTPERVAATVGIDAAAIRDLARRFCDAGSAVAYGRMGVSVQAHGGLCQWLINVLNIVTGNFDRPGGAMFPSPAVDLCDVMGRGSYRRFESRVRGLPEFGGELPVATLAEEILAERDDHIRALVTVAGNPVLSTPNGRQLDSALERLDFMLSIDIYVNETTRHADIILPPTAALEHDHFDIVFNQLAIRNTAKYSAPVFDPAPDTRHDWEIYLALARRLQSGTLSRRLRAKATHWWMERVGPTGLLTRLLKNGPHANDLDFQRLKENPHGIDLGPLQPCLPGRLRTSDKHIELVPEVYANAMPALAAALDEASPDAPRRSMVLVSRRQVRTNNSWMHNYHRLVKGKDRCTLLVHPDDAGRIGLADGGQARVRSRVGEIQATVSVSDEMMPGVASLPHGWGHDRKGIRLRVAAAHPGTSINDLTDHERVDPLSGNAALSGLPVDIAPA